MSLKPHWGSKLPLRRLQKWLRKPYHRWVTVEPLWSTRTNVPKGDYLMWTTWVCQARVPNNMTKVCVVNSKDCVVNSKNYVVSSEKENMEEQWRMGNKHNVTRWEKWGLMQTHEGKMCNASEHEWQNCDSKRYDWRETNLSVKTGKESGDSKCLNGCAQWLWTPKLKKR